MAKVLMNQELNIRIDVSEESIPRDILRLISAAGHPGTIGLVSLRSLLAGEIEEHSGYLIIEGDEETQKTESSEQDLNSEKSEADVKSSEAESAGAAKTEAGETEVSKTEKAERAEETDTQQTNEPEPEPEPDAPKTEASDSSAADALKKTFGINMSKEDVNNLTPKPESAPVKRPRRDMDALIKNARTGKNKALVLAMEAAGFKINNVQTEERWFCMVMPQFDQDDRYAPRFDVSPLQSGKVSVTLYVNDRTTKVRELLAPAEASGVVTPDQVVAAMQKPEFTEHADVKGYVRKVKTDKA